MGDIARPKHFLAAVEAAAECIESIDPEAIGRIVAHPDGYPDLRVSLPELGDGESWRTNPESVCVEQHIDHSADNHADHQIWSHKAPIVR